MQAGNLQAAAAGFLSQLMSGGLVEGEGADSEALQSPKFFETMGRQIRGLLSRSGVDQDALDPLDDQALAAAFVALLQGVPLPVELQTAPVQTAMSMLRSVLQTQGADALPETLPDAETDTASDGAAFAGLAELPAFILEQLSASAAGLGELTGDLSGARTGPSGIPGAMPRDASPASPAMTGLPGGSLRSWLRQLAQASAAGDAGASAGPGADGDWLADLATGLGAASSDRASAFPADTPVELRGSGYARAESIDSADIGSVSLHSVSGSASVQASGAVGTQAGVKAQEALDLTKLLQPGGEQRLAETIRWHARAGLETAELKLHPPSLGALDVRVTMESDKAHVQFVTSHPIVKEVLEAAIPRLREALDRQGLSLGDVGVFEQAPGGQQAPDRGGASSYQTGQDLDGLEGEGFEDGGLASVTLSTLARRLDYFV